MLANYSNSALFKRDRLFIYANNIAILRDNLSNYLICIIADLSDA